LTITFREPVSSCRAMSGSSRASHQYTRCIVSLDSGLRISWAADPDGSYDHGRRHHEAEEEEGYAFTPAGERDFESAQRGATHSLEICEVQVRCTPKFSETKLSSLAERIAKLVAPSK